MSIRESVNHPDTIYGRALDLTVLILILYSMVTLSIETLPDLDPRTTSFLEYSEIVVTLLFTVEYLLRIYASEKRLGYIFSFYGIIDLIAIAPFYLALGMDARDIRAFRLLRIFRLLKLSRYNDAILRFEKAVTLAKEEIVIFSFAVIILLYLSAVGIFYFEHEAQPANFRSIFHSMWWAVATLTTVGYGDIFPITVGGKIFTFLILMLGLGIVAVPAGLLASALTKIRKEQED